MNILGVDYGQKTIGLAWVQQGLDVILPFGTVRKRTKLEQIQELRRIIQEEKIGLVVVGLPFGLESGEETLNTKRVRVFAEELAQHISVPIEFADERLSSFEADTMGGDASRDEKAAMIILQTYVSHRS